MKTLPVSEVKMKLSSLVETVRTTDATIMITKNGVPAAILISPDEFDNLQETLVIRGDDALMKEIKNGLTELRTKKARLYTLDELIR